MSFLKRSRSGSFQPICDDRVFSAYYLGKLPAMGRAGLDCVAGPVASLHGKYKEAGSKRVLLDIRNDGLFVKPSSESSGRLSRRSTVSKASQLSAELRQSFLIPTKDISFGAVDNLVRKAFAVVVRNPDPYGESAWECYVFLCNSHSDAKKLTYELVNAFQKLAKEKGLDLSASSFLTGRTTMSVFTERGSTNQQLAGKKNVDSVITLKVTFNIENVELKSKQTTGVDKNRHIADILAKQELSNKKVHGETIEGQGKTENNNSSSGHSASSDKENEGSDSEILEFTSTRSDKQQNTTDDMVAINLGIASIVDDVDDDSNEKLDAAGNSKETSKNISPSQKPKKPVRKTVRFTAEVDVIPS